MRLLILLTCVIFASAGTIDEFNAWKIKFQKVYANDEEDAYRMKVFSDNKEMINRHNEEAEQGKHTFTLGINQFADLTIEEWRDTLTLMERGDGERKLQDEEKEKIDLPDSVDWRNYGYVTPVKDQGACGSCWSFGVTGVIEGAWMKATGQYVSLSEQNLVDCDTNDYGCSGGLHPVRGAYPWIVQNGGIETEADYPYYAQDMQCSNNPYKPHYTIRAYYETRDGDENDLQRKIATVGPINVGVDAGQPTFQFYSGGVYYDAACSTSPNHAVLTVGYGTDYGTPYYIVKNSWDTWWGEQGYVRMSRNRNNNCGIATDATYVVV